MTASSVRVLFFASVFMVCWLACSLRFAQAQGVSYLYDDLGRLIAVVSPGVGTAVYAYDAVGNLLSITRYAATAVVIVDFTPKQGSVGTTVTIRFPPRPADEDTADEQQEAIAAVA